MDFDGRERDSIDSVKVVLIESYFLVPLLYVFMHEHGKPLKQTLYTYASTYSFRHLDP